MPDHPLLGALDGLAPVIDMHAHPPYEGALVEPMLAAARVAGIRRIILAQLGHSAMIPYPTYEEVALGNQAVYDLIVRHPGFVFGYVYANPNLPEALAVLEDGLARPGVVGIKLWISCRDSEGRLDPVYPVLELATERRTPVLIHAFYRTGGNLPGELSPTDVAHLAARYPNARIVMAHLGGQWHQGVAAVQPYRNVWSDISGSRAYLGSVEYAARLLGVERVLFGSDAFIRNFTVMLSKVAAAELSAAEKRRIVWENSAELFFGEKVAG
jgi:uncharacterized protein